METETRKMSYDVVYDKIYKSKELYDFLIKLEKKYNIEDAEEKYQKLVNFSANIQVPYHQWFKYREGFAAELIQELLKMSGAKKDEVITATANGIISGFGLGNVITAPVQELVTPNDIVWQLSQMIEISDGKKAVSDLTKAMNENSSCYWMLRKIANKGAKG